MKQRARARSRKQELLEKIGPVGRASSAATVMFHQAMADQLGLSATEHKCADILFRSGPISAGELAQITGLTTGAITGIVDRLEAIGLARREKDPNDRRRVIIEPTVSKEHEEMMGELFSSLQEATLKLGSRYNEEELELILDFMQRTTAMMQEETYKLREKTRAMKKR